LERLASPSTWAVPSARLQARVRGAFIVVPGAGLVLGAFASLSDPRLAFLAVAVIFGWSQLAGA
jgi:hypothetical protein